MELQLNKENFNQTLNRFSTIELETLVEKFPYFQQAHLLLAKKYQQQNDPRFDQQLQLAALYTSDRDLLFSIFNEKALAVSAPIELPLEEEPKIIETTVNEAQIPVTQKENKPESIEPILAADQVLEEIKTEEPAIEVKTLGVEEVKVVEAAFLEAEPILEPETEVLQPKEEFKVTEPHTFDEWLQAFSNTETPKPILKQEEIPVEPEKQDQELEKLYIANIPVNLQELVEEETHYSKGLDKFIEEQIQKHKAPPVKMPAYDNEMAPELITETMAKVYEMQKKYTKAIRCYEILALKYPEKNDFFAARINYLKNII